jgi:hypothetical protein
VNWRVLLISVAIFVAAISVYALSSVRKERLASPGNAHFDLLASSFLRGHLHLVDPPSTYDLTLFKGNWYVPFPPLPAILLLPAVASLGINGVNTVFFANMLGAFNVTIMFLILQRMSFLQWTSLNIVDNLWLTILFGIGSVHWFVATLGSVWFLSQLSAVLFVALAVWSAIRSDSAILTGTMLGGAMLARPHLALLYPMLAAIALTKTPAPSQRRTIKRWVVFSTIPLVIAIGALLAYNWARFENPFDFGYQTQNVYPEMAQDLQSFGQFNLQYVPRNFWAMFLALPQWDAQTSTLVPLNAGMSIFITSPALFFLLRARERTPITIGAWASVALVMIPLLTYYNTGAAQFGYRFSLDFMVPVLILLALTAKDRVSLIRILIILGIIVNAWGVFWFWGA